MKKQPLLYALKNIDWMISILSLVGAITVTLLGIFMRYFINQPLAWLEEAQLMFIVWAVFFGGSVAFRIKSHVSIEILVDLFPEKMQKLIETCVLLIELYILGFFIRESFNLVLQFMRDDRVTSILHIPRAFINGGVTVACILMLVNVIIAGIKDILPKKSGI